MFWHTITARLHSFLFIHPSIICHHLPGFAGLRLEPFFSWYNLLNRSSQGLGTNTHSPVDNVETHIPLSCTNLDSELPGVSCGHPCKPDWDCNTELCCEEILHLTLAPSCVNPKPEKHVGEHCTGLFLGWDWDFFCSQIPQGLTWIMRRLSLVYSALILFVKVIGSYFSWWKFIGREMCSPTLMELSWMSIFYKWNPLQPLKTELGCFVLPLCCDST